MKEDIKKIRIAYYTINDPLDKRSWSGATYFMGQILKNNVGDVDFLGPVTIPWFLDKTFRAIQKISRGLFGSEYIPKYSLLKNIYAARVLSKKMRAKQYDFVFAPAAASELAYIKTKLPVVYFGDATYKAYSETYEKEFKNLNSFSRWEGNFLEKKALERSDLVLFSSRWATWSAINEYKISPGKIEVVQMGANIDKVPDIDGIYKKEENKLLTLLFLAVDWDRKGGPIAFDTLKKIHDSGTPVRMIVCGCVPPAEFSHPAMEVIPFLNKNIPADFKQFEEILANAHFLLLPTRADCTPLVNCESNAYGIPVITTDVGGISDAVKEGINGYCLPFDAGAGDYASIILSTFSDKKKYHELIGSSRDRFDKELNWSVFAKNLKTVLKAHKLIDV